MEPLEPRIAPAAIFTYTDVDGDRVLVTTSKGTNADLAAALTFNLSDADSPRQLQTIDLSSNPVFAGTTLTVKATHVGPNTGDGLTAVGFIDASAFGGGAALNLGAVTIDGDLGRILAGTSASSVSVKSLTVASFGLLGTSTQAAAPALEGVFAGTLGALKIHTHLTNADLSANAIGPVKIGGSIFGLSDGAIVATTKIASVHIGGDLRGGSDKSGVVAASEIGAFTLRGSLLGGNGLGSGKIISEKLGAVFIGGDIRAGIELGSGRIECSGPIGAVTVQGSITVEGGSESAGISATTAGPVRIGGSLVGSASGSNSAFLIFTDTPSITIAGDVRAGTVHAAKVGAFSVGGSLIGGSFTESGSYVADFTGRIFVGGDLRAGSGDRSALIKSDTPSSATITVRGSLLADSTSGLNSAELQISDAARLFIGGDLIGGGVTGTETGTGGINAANVKSIFIGGVLQGGPGEDSGKIDASTIGRLRIGAILGGADSESGAITVGSIGTLLIAGDVRGGTDPNSGIIRAESIGILDIRGSFIGGSADRITLIPTTAQGGEIQVDGNLGKLTIAGDIRAGAGDNTAIIAIGGTAGSVTIGGSLVGGLHTADSTGGARVFVAGAVETITVGGSLRGDGTDSAKILTGSSVGSLRVNGDIIGGEGDRSGVLNPEAVTRLLSVGGSIRGGAGIGSGDLNVDSGPGRASFFLRGDIRGGDGDSSAKVDLGDGFVVFTIEGSVIGGSGDFSGQLDVDKDDSVPGRLLLKGDIRGGFGPSSGRVTLDDFDVASVRILGSIVGSPVANTGRLVLDDVTGTIFIGGSIIGGPNNGSGAVSIGDAATFILRGDLRANNSDDAGTIRTSHVKSFSIGGSVIGGFASTATIQGRGFESFTVGGSIIGALTFTPLRIESLPDPNSPQPNLAFGKINVGGSVTFARFHAGFHSSTGFFDTDATIGSVNIKGNWLSSDLVAGASPGPDSRFGDGTDLIPPSATDDPALLATIASITIGGRILGTIGGTDNFGFIAQLIGSLKIAGEPVPLLRGSSNDNLTLAATGDVKLIEL